MNCYPEMLMKNKILSYEVGRFRMTCAENQVIELQTLIPFEVRQGQREEKDVKNEGRSGNVIENKGWRKPSAGRSGNVDENKQLIRLNPDILLKTQWIRKASSTGDDWNGRRGLSG
jgi:hypothetical protein